MSYRVNEVSDDFVKRKTEKEKAGLKYPRIFNTKISPQKVNFPVVKEWISARLNEQLPDDDIVVDYLYELLQGDSRESPDIKAIHIQMKEFLGEKESMRFCQRLWALLVSAQDDPDGIPKEILDERRQQLQSGEDERQSTGGSEDEPKAPRKTNYNRSQYNASKRAPDSSRDTRDVSNGSRNDAYRNDAYSASRNVYNSIRSPSASASRSGGKIRPQKHPQKHSHPYSRRN